MTPEQIRAGLARIERLREQVYSFLEPIQEIEQPKGLPNHWWWRQVEEYEEPYREALAALRDQRAGLMAELRYRARSQGLPASGLAEEILERLQAAVAVETVP